MPRPSATAPKSSLRRTSCQHRRMPAKKSLTAYPGTEKALLLLLLLATLGCGEVKPQAPALRNSPVYQNNDAGLRFLVPERWIQSANSRLPRGTIEKELLLTRYRLQTSEKAAALEVLATDSLVPKQFTTYHRGPSYGVKEWRITKALRPVTIGGQSADRMDLVANTADRDPLVKHVVIFTFGPRTFHFIGFHWSSDPNAEQQIERAIASIAWKSK